MIRRRIRAIAQLSEVSGMGPARLGVLFDAMADAGVTLEELPDCRHSDLAQRLGLTPEQANEFLYAADLACRLAEQLPTKHLSVLVRSEANWPARAIDRPFRPVVPWLFVIGDPAVLNLPSIGIGGSRDATPRSRMITRNVAQRLVARNVTVVSGGARGVDDVAHRAALGGGGATVVVLAQGVGTFQVPEPWWGLIEEGRLAIVSEFGPVDARESFRALQRNATIVRLSDAFLVVQAEAKSGTFSAGRSALQMRSPLFVVMQTGAHAERFPGSEQLLRDGGIPLHVSDDGTISDDDLEALLSAPISADATHGQMRMF